ncbi:MAG: HAD family hydrolase [Sphingobacteriaceae bacterium]|nr:MAG: HAD family hydrolase [Sphingobacteriaceae bacterium]
MKYLLLDVAGTLLYKPELFTQIQSVLTGHGYIVALDKIKYNHKLLSETIRFPDRTSKEFYIDFNAELLYSLGIIPTVKLLDEIFNACSYLPWEKFDDTEYLREVNIPIGILSNFNSSLKDQLSQLFGPVFSDIFVSEELGVGKPAVEFYQRAIDKIGVNANDILYIGDSFKLDLEPAMQLGIQSYVIDRDNFYPNNPNTITSLYDINDII